VSSRTDRDRPDRGFTCCSAPIAPSKSLGPAVSSVPHILCPERTDHGDNLPHTPPVYRLTRSYFTPRKRPISPQRKIRNGASRFGAPDMATVLSHPPICGPKVPKVAPPFQRSLFTTAPARKKELARYIAPKKRPPYITCRRTAMRNPRDRRRGAVLLKPRTLTRPDRRVHVLFGAIASSKSLGPGRFESSLHPLPRKKHGHGDHLPNILSSYRRCSSQLLS